MDRIDFRSDTVTWPTASMRQAMANAPVGDDVYGEDPSVNALEALAAQMLGKEAALLVSSGTMGNTVAILAHTRRGDEAILGIDSHVMMSEAGGMAYLGGVMPRPLATDRTGKMGLGEVFKAVNPDDPHYPATRLILVENSYGSKNGYPIEPAYFQQIHNIAQENGLAVHMDGARVFNAAAALGLDVREMTQHLDSISFCLSKGLSAPVGSILCGSTDFIHKARRVRKVLGGAMRQAGVIAAAGIVALEDMVDRLTIDHENAQKLAAGLSKIEGLSVDLDLIKTNIIFCRVNQDLNLSAQGIADELKKRANIWVDVDDVWKLRFVTHCWVGEPEVDLLLKHLRLIIRI